VRPRQAKDWVCGHVLGERQVGVNASKRGREWVETADPAQVAEFLIGGITRADVQQNAGLACLHRSRVIVLAILVDESLGAFGHDLGDERGRSGDPDAADQVVGTDVPAGGALGAYRHRTRGQDPGQQVGERRGMREREVLRPAGKAEPGGLSGESETGTPLATAVAATVKAWLQRSGSSLPAVTLMTKERSGMAEL
jgi:hypothetical protein